MSTSETNRVKVIPILISLVLILSFISVLFYDGLSDSFNKRKELSQKVDSLKNIYADLKTKTDSLKDRARSTDPRVIWLARVIYSETNRKEEMKYVAWVIRNRVDLNFRGDSTYYSVILASKEFSAFNRGRRFRFYYATKPYNHIYKNNRKSGTWKDALRVAREVVYAESSERPFTKYTLFFYSEISMPSWNPEPEWTSDYELVSVDPIKDKRFRFYADPNYKFDPVPDSIRSEESLSLTTR